MIFDQVSLFASYEIMNFYDIKKDFLIRWRMTILSIKKQKYQQQEKEWWIRMKRLQLAAEREAIFTGSESYFRKICGEPQKDTEYLMEMAWNLREKYEEKLLPRISVSLCKRDEVGISMGEKEDAKEAMGEKKDSEDLLVAYAMSIPEISLSGLDLLEQFYLDSWMTALLDSARDWLRGYLQDYMLQKLGEKRCVSEAFGPGYFNIDLSEIPKILDMAGGDKIGVSWNGKTLSPAKSNVGYYLISKEEKIGQGRDCKHCLSNHKNCIFCKNY